MIGLRKPLNRSKESTLFVDVPHGARHRYTVRVTSKIVEFHRQTGWMGNVVGILPCNEFRLAQT